jgi:hypothetical protein
MELERFEFMEDAGVDGRIIVKWILKESGYGLN